MAVIGDFCGWVEPGVPMAKNADGKWEVAVKSTMDGVLKYKFWYKGTYIYDFKSPDKIDDGFGGNNGLIEVSKVLAKQKAAELAASGDAAGAAALMAQAGAGSSGLKFGTWSMLGFQTKFTVGEEMAAESAGINLRSYWRASGNAVPNMPVFFEIAVAEQQSFNNLYDKGKKEWKDGLKNLLVDTIFDPVYYYGGQTAGATYLGHFKAGFENDWFVYTTGYRYAKLPPHASAIWNTITDNWDAGYNLTGGYSHFGTGNAVSEWTNDLFGAKVKAAIGPNKTADRAGTQYGLYAWASAEFAGQYVDVQYNGAYGKSFDKLFDEIYETDVIVGYKGSFGPVTAKLNVLYSGFGEEKTEGGKLPYQPGNSDFGVTDASAEFINGTAANVQVSYSDDYMDATVGYRHRGAQANLMYVNGVSDQLGGANHMRAWVDFNYKLAYGNVGINPYMTTKLVKADGEKASIEFGAKIFGGYDFDVAKFDAYVNGNYKTEVKKDPFAIGDIGLKVSTPLVMNGLSLAIGFDPAHEKANFFTGIFELGLPAGINAQAGMGLRAAKDDSKAYKGNEFGFFLGANMKLNIPQKPILYTQLVWNMDPYKGFADGQDNLNMDGYTLDAGVKNYAGAGAFRVALRWDI